MVTLAPLNKNEILHFYKGDPITVLYQKTVLIFTSVTLGENENFHFVVEANNWFAMQSKANLV